MGVRATLVNALQLILQLGLVARWRAEANSLRPVLFEHLAAPNIKSKRGKEQYGTRY